MQSAILALAIVLVILLIYITIQTRPLDQPFDYINLNNHIQSIAPECVVQQMKKKCPPDATDKAQAIIRKELALDEKMHIRFVGSLEDANRFVIETVCRRYTNLKHIPGHVVAASTEHPSTITTLKRLEREINGFSYSLVEPDEYGVINPADIEDARKYNTCLIIVSVANCEIGSVQNITAIANMARRLYIPFHTDASAVLGKLLFPLANVDCITSSFGCCGIKKGIVIVRDRMDMHKQLPYPRELCLDDQREVLCGALGLRDLMLNRRAKNERLSYMQDYLIKQLSMHYPLGDYSDYLTNCCGNAPIELVILGRSEYKPFLDKNYDVNSLHSIGVNYNQSNLNARGSCHSSAYPRTPGSVMLSLVKNDELGICATDLKRRLYAKGIQIEVPSRYTLEALKAIQKIKSGAFIISLSDYNTMEELNAVIEAIVESMN